MLGEVHLNRVLWKMPPFAMKALYRQIAVVEQEQFQVRIFEGRVVRTNPKLIAEKSNTEVRIHPTLKEALDDAESESSRASPAKSGSLTTQRYHRFDRSSPQDRFIASNYSLPKRLSVCGYQASQMRGFG